VLLAHAVTGQVPAVLPHLGHRLRPSNGVCGATDASATRCSLEIRDGPTVGQSTDNGAPNPSDGNRF
jgi:hypothetical protein